MVWETKKNLFNKWKLWKIWNKKITNCLELGVRQIMYLFRKILFGWWSIWFQKINNFIHVKCQSNLKYFYKKVRQNFISKTIKKGLLSWTIKFKKTRQKFINFFGNIFYNAKDKWIYWLSEVSLWKEVFPIHQIRNSKMICDFHRKIKWINKNQNNYQLNKIFNNKISKLK